MLFYNNIVNSQVEHRAIFITLLHFHYTHFKFRNIFLWLWFISGMINDFHAINYKSCVFTFFSFRFQILDIFFEVFSFEIMGIIKFFIGYSHLLPFDSIFCFSSRYFLYRNGKKTTEKPIKWVICFSPVLSKVFFYKRAQLKK